MHLWKSGLNSVDSLGVVHAGVGVREGQKLLEELGPGVSLEGLAAGRTPFQAYLERCNSQAGLLAAGALDKQARRALRHASSSSSFIHFSFIFWST